MGIATYKRKTFPIWHESDVDNPNYLSEFERCMQNLPIGTQANTKTNKTVQNGIIQGGVTAGNGKTYLIPSSSTICPIYDPETGEFDNTSITFPAGALKFNGAVLDKTGRYIYCIPHNATYVAIIDTVTNLVDTSTISGLSATGAKWSGGNLIDARYIYCTPWTSPEVLVIDTEDNTTSVFGNVVGNSKWSDGTVSVKNGKIYLTPLSSNVVGIIDTVLKTLNVSTIINLTGAFKWYGGANAPNGKIYFAAYGSSVVGILDTELDQVDQLSITGIAGGSYRFAGITLAPNGKLYCADYQASYCLIIDPSDNSTDTTSITGLSGTHIGITLTSDGKLITSPETGGVAYIYLDSVKIDSDFVLSPLINKY